MKWHLMKHRDQLAKMKVWKERGISPHCPYCNLGLEEMQIDGKPKIGCKEHGVNFGRKRMRRNS